MSLRASVIVPVRNGAGVLLRCLKALGSQTIPRQDYEIIVVDDGSSDDSAEVAQRLGARVIRQAPQGPAVARNRGAQQASAPILLFTDADCAPASDWIERLLLPFSDPQVAGAKGTYSSTQKTLVAQFVQREYEFKYDHMRRFPAIDFIDTYSAAFRKDTFQAAGGFNPAFQTASVEDQELSFRLAAQGAKLIFVPQAQVEHLHADHLLGYLRKKFKIGFYKALLLIFHPGRVRGDTHTPASLQVQMVTLFAAIGCLVLTPFVPGAVVWSLVAFAIFLLSQLPFWMSLLQKQDYAILAITPVMLLLRAVALGTGLLCGTAYFGVKRIGQLLRSKRRR